MGDIGDSIKRMKQQQRNAAFGIQDKSHLIELKLLRTKLERYEKALEKAIEQRDWWFSELIEQAGYDGEVTEISERDNKQIAEILDGK